MFTLLCGISEGFMKAFKAFIKPFESPQRSTKIKNLSLYFNETFFEMDGTGTVKNVGTAIDIGAQFHGKRKG